MKFESTTLTKKEIKEIGNDLLDESGYSFSYRAFDNWVCVETNKQSVIKKVKKTKLKENKELQ
tara:strand:- start:499 stop:687 length:189 start_codon:yes stop_codon:yes gene_type:complete